MIYFASLGKMTGRHEYYVSEIKMQLSLLCPTSLLVRAGMIMHEYHYQKRNLFQ